MLTVYNFKATVLPALQNQDTLTLQGVLPNVPQGFTATGKTLTLFIGDLQLAFPLNTRNQSKTVNGSLALTLKTVRDRQTGQRIFLGGDVPFKMSLKALGLSTTLGLTASTPSETLTSHLIAVLPNIAYSTDVGVTYYPGGKRRGKVVK